ARDGPTAKCRRDGTHGCGRTLSPARGVAPSHYCYGARRRTRRGLRDGPALRLALSSGRRTLWYAAGAPGAERAFRTAVQADRGDRDRLHEAVFADGPAY